MMSMTDFRALRRDERPCAHHIAQRTSVLVCRQHACPIHTACFSVSVCPFPRVVMAEVEPAKSISC